MTSSPAAPPTQPRMDSQPLYQPAGKEELRQALLTATWDDLPTVSAGLGILYGIYAVLIALYPPDKGALVLGLIAGLTALVMLGLYAAFRRNLLSMKWNQPLAGGIAALVLLNSLLPLFLGLRLEYTLPLLLAVAAAGYYLLLPGWLEAFTAIGLAGWLLGFVLFAHTYGWPISLAISGELYEILLVVSCLLALTIRRSRINTYRQLEGLRLQNLQRKAELQRVLRATDEAQRSLATSIAVGQRIVSILDLDVLLGQVTSLIQERYRCDFVGIFLVDENDANYLLARAGAGEVGVAMVEQGLRLKIGEEGIIGWVAAHRRPLCVADTSQDPRYIPHELLPETRSELALPLEMGKLLLGVLDMESTRPGAFNENDVPFLHLLADQAASALHNARLYKQVNLFNQDLEKLVQQRTEILERMDRAKSDFISVTSHELRTPLTLLRGYGQMLGDEAAVKGSGPLTIMVNGILAGADRLHAIVDSMLDVAKIDHRVLELNYTSFSMQALLRLVCEDLKGAMAERQLTVEQDLRDLPHIEADLDALRKMFTELVGNAVKYTPDGGRITVSGRVLPTGAVLEDDSVEIVVSDTGIGIEPQIQELIFTKFYRTGPVATYSSSKTRFMGGGPGLGLSIAKGIAEAHGGIIWAESPGYDEKLLPGSKFHVILPLHQPPQNEGASQ
jgi:signal transduction histidine kinase